jgi:hypothetical protein
MKQRKVGDTLLNEKKQEVILRLLKKVGHITACTAEVGVYMGGSSILIAQNNGNDMHYACDTYTGIPLYDPEEDIHKTGDFRDTPKTPVIERLIQEPNIKPIIGVFPYSLMREKVLYKFVHYDGDIAQGLRETLKYFPKRMVAGGIIVVDDYGHEKTPAIKPILDEWGGKNGIDVHSEVQGQAWLEI